MAVLSFRGTEQTSWQDIKADLDARFYMDAERVMIHNGFYLAFACVEQEIRDKISSFKDYSLYITGHSLGGALALIVTRALDSDNLSSCYTFGSPKVGNSEFADVIKAPIYRIVNSLDPVPGLPATYIVNVINFLIGRFKIVIPWLAKFGSFAHHGDQRFLTACDDYSKVEVRANYNDVLRICQMAHKWIKNRKIDADDHNIDSYCEKLGQYALKRLSLAPRTISSQTLLPSVPSNRGGTTLNIFDSYERRARVLPGILLALPLVILCACITPLISRLKLLELSMDGIFAVALLVFFSNIVRQLGKNIEAMIWKQWGGPPSTRYLRPSDTTLAIETKNQFYKKILEETGIDLPNNPSDERIMQAFKVVRETLRRKDKEGLWINSNREYGFARNLLGSRVMIVVFSFVSTLLCFALIKIFPADSTHLLIGAGLSFAYGVITIIVGWGLLPGLTKGNAEQYAEQAIIAYVSLK